MKIFNWVKVSHDKVTDSMFKNMHKEKPDIPWDEVEDLFQKKEIKKKETKEETDEAPKPVKPKKVSLVDPKKAQSCGIFLSVSKKTPEQIKSLILTTPRKIDLETASRLVANCPTPEDVIQTILLLLF